ncbi:MAG: hydrogenase maturation protease [Bacteroidales bacterium]
MTDKKTLILGLGNEILSDDKIGPVLIHDLSQRINLANVWFTTAASGGLEIMELIKDYEKVVFIDAIHTRDGKPGDVYYFEPADFRETSHLSSLHDIDFLTAIRLGNLLEINLPVDLHFIAIEIIEDREFSEEFTQPLKEKYQEILEQITEKINHILE